MIDVAATARALRENRRNPLKQIINPRTWRSLLFSAAALALLGAGWFTVHHMGNGGAVPAVVPVIVQR